MIGLLLKLFLLTSFGIQGQGLRSLGLTDDQAFTTEKLRNYCRACHALGQNRFIFSEDNQQMWDYISTHDSPISHNLWVKQIVERLNWPTPDSPPASETQWMPKGIKRIELSEDIDNDTGESARLRMLRTLKAGQRRRR